FWLLDWAGNWLPRARSLWLLCWTDRASHQGWTISIPETRRKNCLLRPLRRAAQGVVGGACRRQSHVVAALLHRPCRRRGCLGDGVWAWRLQAWGGYGASDQACDARARRRWSCRVDRLGAVSACAPRRSRGRSGTCPSWAAHQANHQACTTAAGLTAQGLDSP